MPEAERMKCLTAYLKSKKVSSQLGELIQNRVVTSFTFGYIQFGHVYRLLDDQEF